MIRIKTSFICIGMILLFLSIIIGCNVNTNTSDPPPPIGATPTPTSSVLGTPTPIPGNSSLVYFITQEGYGIKYHVTDSSEGIDTNYWAISQHCETNKPSPVDFVFTVGESADNSISTLGGGSQVINGKPYTMFGIGAPSKNQGHFYMNFCLPRFFDFGALYSFNFKSLIEYQVLDAGTQTVNGTTFSNCIRININNTSNPNPFCAGSGYFLLAKNIGIVKLVFTRNDASAVTYEYLEHGQQTAHTVTGRILNGATPVAGKKVWLAVRDMGMGTQTDSSGNFTLQNYYGPELVLRIGDDADNNYELDVFPSLEYPRTYAEGYSGFDVDISSL